MERKKRANLCHAAQMDGSQHMTQKAYSAGVDSVGRNITQQYYAPSVQRGPRLTGRQRTLIKSNK